MESIPLWYHRLSLKIHVSCDPAVPRLGIGTSRALLLACVSVPCAVYNHAWFRGTAEGMKDNKTAKKKKKDISEFIYTHLAKMPLGNVMLNDES